MKDNTEWKGYWWLPDAEDNKLSGTLSFSQENGARLELVGVFGTERNARIEQPAIILGDTQQGKPITLYKCVYTQWTYPMIGLGGGTYHVHFVFDGVHFDTEEKIAFHQLRGSYTDLEAWVGIHGFTFENERVGNKHIHKVAYEMPSSQTFDVSDDFEVGISFSYRGSNRSIVQTEVKISQQAYLVINSKKGDVKFENIFSKLNIILDLLQVAVQRVPYPITIFGFSRENVQVRDSNEPDYPKIDIYYQPIEALSTKKPIIPQDMLFTYKDLGELEIKNWFQSFETHQTIIHLYRSLFYSNRLFVETKFLSIVQALESLHSILFDNYIFPNSEFKVRKKKIFALIPDEEKEWVIPALENANFKRFKLKISELLNNKLSYISSCIDDLDIFSNKVAGTRNKFVHYTEQKWFFQNGTELTSAIKVLTMLFEIYLLEIIGFSDEKMQELMEPKIKTHLTGWKHLRSKKK
jgi:hypothetical protein